MCNRSYCAENAHNVSSKHCKAIVEKAAQLSDALDPTTVWEQGTCKVKEQTAHETVLFALNKQ